MPAKKDGKFDIQLHPTTESVTWSHKKATVGPLVISLDEMADEDMIAAARLWFTVKGMQTHMEQRTSQDGANGFDAVLTARSELWDNICAKGHEFKEERTGGGFSISKEVQAVSDVYDVTPNSVLASKRAGTDEKWAEVIAQPKVVARIAELEETKAVPLDAFLPKAES